MCVCVRARSVVSDSLWHHGFVACQTPLSMEFSRQEYWSMLPFSIPRDPPNPGIKPVSLASPELAGRFFITEPPSAIRGPWWTLTACTPQVENQYLQIHRISLRTQESRLQGREKAKANNLTKETAFQCQTHLGVGRCSLDLCNRNELVFTEYWLVFV